MNANANDSLIAAPVVGAMLALTSPPVRAVAGRARARRRSSGRRRWRRCSRPDRRAPVARRRSSSASSSSPSRRPSSSLPAHGGLREFYDRTLGYQASRSSPFSVWGQAPSLHFLQSAERVMAARPGVRGCLVAPAQDPGPDRRARGGGDDRRPARRDALVLLLRRLVPAARSGRRCSWRSAAARGRC